MSLMSTVSTKEKQMKNLESELESVLAEVQAYNNKPNKSISKRIRTQLGALKLRVTGIRSDLVERDKKGYA